MMTSQSLAYRFVRGLEDDIRAGIPDVKIFGRSLTPKRWTDEQVAHVAARMVELIRAVHNEQMNALTEAMERAA